LDCYWDNTASTHQGQCSVGRFRRPPKGNGNKLEAEPYERRFQHALHIIYDRSSMKGGPICIRRSYRAYIQHNPLMADGVDGVMAFLKQAGASLAKVKRPSHRRRSGIWHVR